MTSIDFLNDIRKNATTDYKERIPQATQDNLALVGGLLTSLDNKALLNEFSGFLGKIALTVFTSRMYENPLKILKKGKMPLGQTLEEIFVEIAKGKDFDPSGANNMAKVKADSIGLYHSKEFNQTYSKSVSRKQVINAFTDEATLDSFFTEVINSLYSGYETDEYLIMKQLLLEDYANGALRTVDSTPILTVEEEKELLASIREETLKMGFQSNEYNGLGVTTHSKAEDLVLLVDATLLAHIGVNVFASAFNLSEVNWQTKIIPIDNFDFIDNLSERQQDKTDPTIIRAMLVDSKGIKVYDKDIFMDEDHNGKGAFTTYHLHVNMLLGKSHVTNICTWITNENVGVVDVSRPTRFGNIIDKTPNHDTIVFCGDVTQDKLCAKMPFTGSNNGKFTCYIDGALAPTGKTITLDVTTFNDAVEKVTSTITSGVFGITLKAPNYIKELKIISHS